MSPLLRRLVLHNSHRSDYSHQVGEEIQEVVATVVGRFIRLRAPGDPREMVQEAYKIVLSTCAKYPEHAMDKAYLYGAVNKSLGNWVSKQLTILTIKSDFTKARNIKAVSLNVHRGKDEIPLKPQQEERRQQHLLERATESQQVHVTPEALLLETERKTRLLRWRIQFRRALDRATKGFTEEEKHIVDRLFGFDGLASEDAQDLAERLEIPRRRVYAARKKLLRRALDDLQLKVLQMELEEITGELAEDIDI